MLVAVSRHFALPPKHKPTLARAAARLLALGRALALGWRWPQRSRPSRYLPAARDFEQRLPAVERVADAARPAAEDAHRRRRSGDPRSRVIEAPARFDAVGLARELRPVELRARERRAASGREWTRDRQRRPGLVRRRRRASGAHARLAARRARLHYVDVPEAGVGRARGARQARHRLAPRLGRRAAPGRLRAAAPARLRAGEGGGRPPHRRRQQLHARRRRPSVVLAICRYHRNALDWDDIGYQRAGRQLREHLRGPRRRPRPAGDRGAGAGRERRRRPASSVMGTYTKRGHHERGDAGRIALARLEDRAPRLTTKGRARLVSGAGRRAATQKGDRFSTQAHRRPPEAPT